MAITSAQGRPVGMWSAAARPQVRPQPDASPAPAAPKTYLDDPPKPRLTKHSSFWSRLWAHLFEAGAHVVTYLKQPLMPTLAFKRTIEGYVVAPENRPNVDGDIDIDVAPLPQDRGVLDFHGKYRPVPAAVVEADDPQMSARARSMLEAGAVHCEIKTFNRKRLMPEITRLRQLAAQGKTPLVEVTGRWTYDPFHQGWTEIHPVSGIKIVADDYSAKHPAPGGS